MILTINSSHQSLLDIVFNMVLNDLQQHADYLISLIELFLAHICQNGSIEEFVKIHLDEASQHLDRILLENEKQNWWHEMNSNNQTAYKLQTRQRYFKSLSNGIKQLYVLIRNCRSLQSDKFVHVEYPYLNLTKDKYDIIHTAASSVKREDYFLIGCISVAFQHPVKRGYTIWQLIDVLSESVSTFRAVEVIDLKQEKGEHTLIKYVENVLRSKVSTFKKFCKHTMIPLIVKMLVEYYDPDNPFQRSPPILTLNHSASPPKDTALISDMESEFAITDNAHVVKASVITIEQQQQHIVSASSTPSTTTSITTTSSQHNENATERKRRVQQRIKDLLRSIMQPFIVKPNTIPDTSPTSSFSSIVLAKSGKPASKPGPFPPIAELLNGGKISKKEALQFFYSKKLQFDGIEDCIVSNQGLRHYDVIGNSNSNKDSFLAAGVLTCILHAIRLLFVDRLLPESDFRKYQELLTTMAAKMRSWTLDEVLKGLKLEDSLPELSHATTNQFKSFVEKVRDVHEGFFTVLPTTSWSKFFDQESQQHTVEGLYYGSTTTRRDRRNHIFFLSFADSPPPNLPLPYLFHCRRGSGDTYTEERDGTLDMCDDSLDKNRTTLQLVGLIYRDEKGEYSFTMITYARCIDLGQYQVFTKEQTGNIKRLFPVPYSNAPNPVFASDSAGRQVVGLVLVRNNNQREQQDTQFLKEPVLRVIHDNCSYSAKEDSRSGSRSHCDIRSSMLKTLDYPETWLLDETVHGTVFLMCDHLKATHGLNSNNSFYICTSLAFDRYVEGGRPSTNFPQHVKGCAYSLFIINITNSHWVCACAPMNEATLPCNKKIYFLDSMNNIDTAIAKGELLIKFFEECWITI